MRTRGLQWAFCACAAAVAVSGIARVAAGGTAESTGQVALESTEAGAAAQREGLVLPKIDRRRQVREWPMKALSALPKYEPGSQNPFQVDLRFADLRGLDLSQADEDLSYATYGTRTRWPGPEALPAGFDPRAVMETGRNPGLGVRSLHARGVTGKGVRIAVVDAALAVEHVEYRDRLRLYEEVNVPPYAPAGMHGPAVASIAVGKSCGVAPEAELFFIATVAAGPEAMREGSSMQRDFTWYAQAVRRVVEINRQLPEGGKIRAISLSIGWDRRERGYAGMVAAVEEAKEAGILVTSSSMDETYRFPIHGLGRQPLADPDVFESYEPGLFWARQAAGMGTGRLLIPMDSRTTADFTGNEEYAFYRSGGWSWITPYLAGVYALACQVKPDVTPEEFLAIAMEKGRTVEIPIDGEKRAFGPIIDPAAIIDALEDAAKKQNAGGAENSAAE